MNKSLSIKTNTKNINLIFKYLNKFQVNTNNINVLYFFKTKKYSITVYKNNTILFQGNDYENILKMINYYNTNHKQKNNSQLNIYVEYGSDEVGTGDLFGGIIVCAAKIINIDEIKKYKIMDSKNYSNDEIKIIFNKIKDLIIFSKFELLPKQYNELYNKYKNLNILKTLGHYKCLNEINDNNGYGMIDQFADEKNIKKYLSTLEIDYNEKYLLETKAENKYLQVACASIVARYFFIKQIEYLSNEAKFNIPFGSNNLKTKRAIEKIKQENKINYIKLNFKNAI